MKKEKKTVIIGVLTGVLVGFVLGAVYGTPVANPTTSGLGKGNVSEISRFRYSCGTAAAQEGQQEADNLTYTLTASDGQSWNITMTKK